MSTIDIKKLIEASIEEIESEEKKSGSDKSWLKVPITPEECKMALKPLLDRQVRKKKPSGEFVLDRQSEPIIDQVTYYITGDKRFNGMHHKQIILIGNFGTGKTTIMKALCEFYFITKKRIISSISAVEMASLIKNDKNTIDDFSKKPLFIDEVGRETEKVIGYGTEIRPFADVLDLRYSKGVVTFATSNFFIEKKDANGGLSLEDKYGTFISERMREMFNVFILKGDSRRI